MQCVGWRPVWLQDTPILGLYDSILTTCFLNPAIVFALLLNIRYITYRVCGVYMFRVLSGLFSGIMIISPLLILLLVPSLNVYDSITGLA